MLALAIEVKNIIESGAFKGTDFAVYVVKGDVGTNPTGVAGEGGASTEDGAPKTEGGAATGSGAKNNDIVEQRPT